MKIAFGIEYCGTHFHGWQSQNGRVRTVQETIQDALSRVANHPIVVFAAGRTDAGVHASEQVIHCEVKPHRDQENWLFGANAYLPQDVSLRWAKFVDFDFHAQFDARSRLYHYYIYNGRTRSPLRSQFSHWQQRPLNLNQMKQAASYLHGRHDFSAFKSAHCQARSPNRMVHKLELAQQGDEICISIEANGFLQHMVRNIVGTLLEVGLGKFPPDWVADVLKSRDRTTGGPTLPACGLFLMKASYDSKKLITPSTNQQSLAIHPFPPH